jgi:hypothetical protein
MPMLRAMGVDVKVAQKLLRQANVRTTLHIYTRAVCAHQREASIKVVEMMLPGAPKWHQHPRRRRHPRKLLVLVDLVGIEPMTSSMPCWTLIASYIQRGTYEPAKPALWRYLRQKYDKVFWQRATRLIVWDQPEFLFTHQAKSHFFEAEKWSIGNSKLASNGNDGLVPGLLAASGCEMKIPLSQRRVLTVRSEDMVRTLDQ